MNNKKELSEIMEHITQNEISKLRQYYKDTMGFDNYLYDVLKKIFKKLAFPYFRFEILLCSIEDIINTNKLDSNTNKKDINRIKSIFKRIQKICTYLNIALYEFDKLINCINKNISD